MTWLLDRGKCRAAGQLFGGDLEVEVLHCGGRADEMAGGGNFLGRVMQYLVNELLVDRLSNK